MVVGQRESLALRSAFCTFHTIPLIYIELEPMMFTSFASSNSLRDQRLSVLVLVHPFQMLLEIIKSRPLLITLWAALPETLVLPAMAMFWLDLVNTLLMSLEIVDGCEALRS
jgi:hypothetical protein